MADAGAAVMRLGRATGEHRASQAAERALSSPMLESSMEGAKGVLLSVAGPTSMTLHEATEAARIVADHADPEAEFIFGAIVDDDLGEEMKVTVIAAGFDKRRPNRAAPGSSTPASASSRGYSDGEDDLDIPNFVQG
jgi:cell division protein FtsZ